MMQNISVTETAGQCEMGDPSSITREDMSGTERAICNVSTEHAHH